MPPRRLPQPEPTADQTALRVPDAEEWLAERITRGRELSDERPPSWDELEDLGHRIDQWRKYNQTWLDQKLGGEAAEDYKAASVHWNSYSGPNPTTRLNALRREIGGELSSLQSIYDRLDLWLQQGVTDSLGSSRTGIIDPEPTGPIFVVHGHDDARKYELVRLLERAAGPQPIVLHEQADRGQTIIEKLERHAQVVSFAVILLTGDDEGRLRADASLALKPRGRQNVVLEMGMFIGLLGRSRVAVLKDADVEVPSDLSGVIYIELDAGKAWCVRLLKELAAAEITVDFSSIP